MELLYHKNNILRIEMTILNKNNQKNMQKNVDLYKNKELYIVLH